MQVEITSEEAKAGSALPGWEQGLVGGSVSTADVINAPLPAGGIEEPGSDGGGLSAPS